MLGFEVGPGSQRSSGFPFVDLEEILGRCFDDEKKNLFFRGHSQEMTNDEVIFVSNSTVEEFHSCFTC
jgi:hypothetical protein